MNRNVKILGIHGLGDHRSGDWIGDWRGAIESSFPDREGITPIFTDFSYDEIFEKVDISAGESWRAFWKLTKSGVTSPFSTRRERATRGIGDWFSNQIAQVQEKLRWWAGYIVAWVEDEGFRKEVRKKLLDRLNDVKPDVILAHSLGSLISYDALSHSDLNRRKSLKNHLAKSIYVTLGSQIGNAFVRGNLGNGRIEMLPVKKWLNLFNPEDDVFVKSLRLHNEPNYRQIVTEFDIDGFADHSAVEYLSHNATVINLWEPVSLAADPAPVARATSRSLENASAPWSSVRKPQKKALLVGINDYPDPKDRLQGCVNDVFLVSSVLQECGFQADDIRVVLNERATARGILSRMEWLMEDVLPDDELFFYYSGHGARLPTYGMGEEIDRRDETLVPWDFDWSPETCITDDSIFELYSQLPFDTNLVMAFDCCHSGGIHRDGGARIRGLAPPDDIRHRALKWDVIAQMWVERDLVKLNSDFARDGDRESMEKYVGADGSTLRLGRGMSLRPYSDEEYAAAKRSSKQPVGPFLPVIIEACSEHEFSYEYRHGVESYGAFTYTLAKTLRNRKRISYTDLVEKSAEQLRELRYDQTPQILGPSKIVGKNVPWMR